MSSQYTVTIPSTSSQCTVRINTTNSRYKVRITSTSSRYKVTITSTSSHYTVPITSTSSQYTVTITSTTSQYTVRITSTGSRYKVTITSTSSQYTVPITSTSCQYTVINTSTNSQDPFYDLRNDSFSFVSAPLVAPTGGVYLQPYLSGYLLWCGTAHGKCSGAYICRQCSISSLVMPNSTHATTVRSLTINTYIIALLNFQAQIVQRAGTNDNVRRLTMLPAFKRNPVKSCVTQKHIAKVNKLTAKPIYWFSTQFIFPVPHCMSVVQEAARVSLN
jgi:hypothetical protein